MKLRILPSHHGEVSIRKKLFDKITVFCLSHFFFTFCMKKFDAIKSYFDKITLFLLTKQLFTLCFFRGILFGLRYM